MESLTLVFDDRNQFIVLPMIERPIIGNWKTGERRVLPHHTEEERLDPKVTSYPSVRRLQWADFKPAHSNAAKAKNASHCIKLQQAR